MANLVNFVKPILFFFQDTTQVKLTVIALLERYAKSTKNNLDDSLVELVKNRLFNIK